MIHSAASLKISPFENIISLKFLMTKKIGEHTKIEFSGQIRGRDGEKYLNVSDNQLITAFIGGEKIFSGYIENISLRQVAQDYYIEGRACSLSLELDVQKKTRTFQDIKMTYEEIIKKIAEESKFVVDIDPVVKGPIEFPIIQYRESDWEFLRRIASRFHKEIIADSVRKLFYVGTVDRRSYEVTTHAYSLEKDIEMYRNILMNQDETITSNNFVSYTMQSEMIIEAGEFAKFFGKEYEVREGKIMTKGSEILGEYKIYTPNKYVAPLIVNKEIAGKSFCCEVLKVEGNKVKLCLNDLNDKKAEDKAFLFPYITPYSSDGTTGMYIMPEIGDMVIISFPTDNEADAIITGSIRKEAVEGDKHSDPNVKYIRTKNGKEIMFDEKSIKISGKDSKVFIQMIDGEGINVYSESDITIQSKGNLSISSGKELTLESQKEITIISKNAVSKMTQSGYEVKAGTQKYN